MSDATEQRVPVLFETERAIVRLATDDDVPAIVRYYDENREHLQPYDPTRPPYFYEERFWRRQIRQNVQQFSADVSLRLFIFPAAEPSRVIGNIGLANFVRGAGQYCTLGYSIAADHEGRGLMSEALEPVIRFAFSDLHMHRIEANYMPHNRRSGRLLRRMGFIVEGYARDYLRIDGRWEDHVRSALVNPRWIDQPEP